MESVANNQVLSGQLSSKNKNLKNKRKEFKNERNKLNNFFWKINNLESTYLFAHALRWAEVVIAIFAFGGRNPKSLHLL